MGSAEWGAVTYRDSRSVREMWAVRGFFVAFSVLLTGYAWLAATSDPDLSPWAPIFVAFSLSLCLGMLMVVWLRIHPMTIHANGIALPFPRTRGEGTVRFLRFSEIEWVYAPVARPWVGVRLGFHDGVVWGLPRHGVEAETLTATISGSVKRVDEDPQVLRMITAFDRSPDVYLDFWDSGPPFTIPMPVLVVGTAAGTLGLTFGLVALGVRGVLVVVALLTALLVPLFAYLYWEERGRFPEFMVRDMAPAAFFSLMDAFLTKGRRHAVPGSSAGLGLWSQRTYALPEAGAELRVERHRGGGWRRAGWRVVLRHPRDGGATTTDIQTALARFAIEQGIGPLDWYKPEIRLYDLEHPEE